MRNVEGRFALGITNDIKIVLSGKYGIFTRQSSSAFRYMQEIGMPSVIPGTDIVDPVKGVPTKNNITHELGKVQATNQ
jgi:hypothetical protein